MLPVALPRQPQVRGTSSYLPKAVDWLQSALPPFSEWTCCSLCLVTSVYVHTKPNPCLLLPLLSLSCEVGKTPEVSSQMALLFWRHDFAPTVEAGKASGLCVCKCVWTGPNMLPGQPHQSVCYATYQTDTCRRNYGMSIAGPNPDITRRPLVRSFSYRMSASGRK